MLRTLTLIFLLFVYPLIGNTQVSPEIPVLPNQFFNLPGLYNPAYMDYSNKLKATCSYQSYTGIRKNRKTLFLEARIAPRLSPKKDASSSYGITVTSQKTGAYINRNRLHFLYSYRMKMSKKIDLTAGASIGIYNLFIADNPSGVSHSTISPDGNFSLRLKYKNTGSLSIGVNQLFNNRLNEDRELLFLKRFYLVQADHYLRLSSIIKLENGALLRFIPEDKVFSSFYSLLHYNELLSGGIIYHEKQGGIIGTVTHDTNKNEFSVSFSYHFPLGKNTIINSNTYNISLNLFLK